MAHYTHQHVVRVEPTCVPCDCYVCLLSRSTDRRAERLAERERRVEVVTEEIERQLRDVGTTSIMGVWNSLTGWPCHTHSVTNWRFEWPSPSLINIIRNVFRSLDRHGVIECARYDRTGRRCTAWREKR